MNVSGELSSHPRRNAGVLSRRLKPNEPAIVLLDPKSGEYYTLDEVGSRIWELCDGSRSLADIAVVVGQEFDASAEVIQADVCALVRELADEALVVRDP